MIKIDDKHIEHNGSGYIDPAVDYVIKKEYNEKARKKEDYKYKQMVKQIKKILESNDYILDGPISLINVKSGRKKRIY